MIVVTNAWSVIVAVRSAIAHDYSLSRLQSIARVNSYRYVNYSLTDTIRGGESVYEICSIFWSDRWETLKWSLDLRARSLYFILKKIKIEDIQYTKRRRLNFWIRTIGWRSVREFLVIIVREKWTSRWAVGRINPAKNWRRDECRSATKLLGLIILPLNITGASARVRSTIQIRAGGSRSCITVAAIATVWRIFRNTNLIWKTAGSTVTEKNRRIVCPAQSEIKSNIPRNSRGETWLSLGKFRKIYLLILPRW